MINRINPYYNNVNSLLSLSKKFDKVTNKISKGNEVAKNIIKEDIIFYDFKANIVSIKTQNQINKSLLNIKI